MSSFLLKSSEQNHLLLSNEIKPKLLPSGQGCDYVFHMPFALKGMLRHQERLRTSGKFQPGRDNHGCLDPVGLA